MTLIVVLGLDPRTQDVTLELCGKHGCSAETELDALGSRVKRESDKEFLASVKPQMR